MLNEKLQAARERQARKRKLVSSLGGASAELAARRARLEGLEEELAKEQRDVEKLEGLSLTALFHRILSSRTEQLDQERQEYLAVKLRHDECKGTIADLEKRIAHLEENLATLGDPDAEVEALLNRKAANIAGGTGATARELERLTLAIADLREEIREIGEAAQEGESSRQCLHETAASLDEARGWGQWDMLGGGMVTTHFKHDHIDRARESVEEAQHHLAAFERELQDLAMHTKLDIELERFERFADFFFDGLIFDWVVQSKIVRSLDATRAVLEEVEDTLDILRTERDTAESNLAKLEADRAALIERA